LQLQRCLFGGWARFRGLYNDCGDLEDAPFLWKTMNLSIPHYVQILKIKTEPIVDDVTSGGGIIALSPQYAGNISKRNACM
jgi:hypothetical protein